MFPNNDPVMFMVAFYGCLLAELVPVPIEVPLTRKVLVSITQHTDNTIIDFNHNRAPYRKIHNMTP